MATLTVTPNNTFAFMSITAGSLTGINTVSISRNNPNGSTSPVRSAQNVATGGASTLAFQDYEAPLDQAVTYTLTPDTGSTVTSASATIVTDGHTYWLKNVAQEALSAKVVVADMSAVIRGARILATYPVLGRANPIVVSDVRSGRAGSLVLTTADIASERALLALLASGGVLFLQCPATTNFGDMYFTPGDVTEAWVGKAPSLIRTFSMPFTEVDSPPDSLVSSGANSWQQVTLFGSWNNLKNKRTTWLDVLNRPFTNGDAG